MFDSWFKSNEPKDPCVGCDNLRTNNDSATALYRDLQAVQKKIDAHPTNGENYADLAENYLKSALNRAEKGDLAGTLMMLEGGPRAQQKHPDGSHINADGARNALEMAFKHGADPERTRMLARESEQISDFVNSSRAGRAVRNNYRAPLGRPW